MDIARIIYRVQAMENGSVPIANGKLLHGAVFNMLKEQSPELANNVHDNVFFKSFTLSPLCFLNAGQEDEAISRYRVKAGQLAEICVTAFSHELIKAFVNIPNGHILEIGTVPFILKNVFTEPSQHEEAVMLTKDEFMDSMPPRTPEFVTLQYVSPATFRLDASDYPFPEPRRVWGTLALKWNQLDMPEPVNVAQCKEVAEQVVPWKWEGKTERLKFNKNIAVTGFVGKFTYSLHNLNEEQRRIFYRLANFAEFAGVGRMTAQGMGQTRIAEK